MKVKNKRGAVEITNYKTARLQKNYIVKCGKCGKKGKLENMWHMEREGVTHVTKRTLTGNLFYLTEDIESCDYINEVKKSYCLALRRRLEAAYPIKKYQRDLNTQIAKEYYKKSTTKEAVLNVLKPYREKAATRIRKDREFMERTEKIFEEVGAQFYEY